MPQATYISDEPTVIEFAKMFNFGGFQNQQQDFKALIDYVSNVERQYNSILNELNALKEQVSNINDKKSPLVVMVEKTQDSVSDLGQRLSDIKENILAFTQNALETLKDKGLIALGSVFSTLKVKDRLQGLSESLEKSVLDADKSIQKIDAMSREYHEMGNRAANIGRLFLGKETSDEVKENGKLAVALQLPYLGIHKAFLAIDNAVINAVNRVQNLENYVAETKGVFTARIEDDVIPTEAQKNEAEVTAITVFTSIENNLDKLSPTQLQATYQKLLNMGMNTDLTTDENACLQGLVDKMDTMLPKLELSQESEVLALTQGAEI